MSDKEIMVTLVRKEDTITRGGKEEKISFYVLEFPQVKVDERALVCYRLAKFAIDNGKNPKYCQSDIGYIRDLFLGTTLKRLYQFWSVPGEDTVYFRFREIPGGDQNSDVTIALKTKALEKAQFIIED